MKHLISTLLLFGLLACIGRAQTVDYSYKIFAAEGCAMTYSIAKQDSSYYIIATVRSDRLKFHKESTMLLKNFDGEVIKLYGYNIGDGSETGAVLVYNVMCPITEINSTAQFEVTPEQMEFFRNGISKIRLSTYPIEHERTFRKDKIGKKLYKLYLKQRDKDESF